MCSPLAFLVSTDFLLSLKKPFFPHSQCFGTISIRNVFLDLFYCAQQEADVPVAMITSCPCLSCCEVRDVETVLYCTVLYCTVLYCTKEPIAQLSQRGYIALIAGRVEVAMIVMFTILNRRVRSVWHQMSVDHTSNGRRILDTGMTLVYNLFDAHLRLSPPYPFQSRWRRFPSFRHH